MSDKSFGMDLGTNSFKLYRKGKGIALHQKNIIAIKNAKEITAYGDEAYDMYERAPESIEVSFPMIHGVIAHFQNMQSLLRMFMNDHSLRLASVGKRDYYIAVPYNITEVEKRAFLDLVAGAGIRARQIFMVEKPIADALGAGVPVEEARGVMVVNIGADTTEISILSLGGIVLSKLLHIGGNQLDDSICSQVKKKYNLIIGRKTACRLKCMLACAFNDEEIFKEPRKLRPVSLDRKEEKTANEEGQEAEVVTAEEVPTTMVILGRDIITGLPMRKEITYQMVYDAISEYLLTIIDAAKVILERTPPELAADIIHSGIYLTGGGSRIHQIDTLFEEHLDLKANLVENPEESVIRGLGKIMETKEYESLAAVMKL